MPAKKCANRECFCAARPAEPFCSDACRHQSPHASPGLTCGCGHRDCAGKILG